VVTIGPMTDPSDSKTPPDRLTVELALRVAEHEAAKEVGRLYWRGAADSLRWASTIGCRVPVPTPNLV
jgi:hypothetical protein